MLDLPLTLTDTILKPARLCTITKTNGDVVRVAEAQTSFTIGGQTWAPLAGFKISAVKHAIGAEAASVQLEAALSEGGTFDLSEVVDGFFDNATVQIDVIDRATAATRGFLFSGRIEPVRFGALHHSVQFDVQGHTVKGKWPFSWTFGPMCRTELGSDLCRIPLRPSQVLRNQAYVTKGNASTVDGYAVRVSDDDSGEVESFGNVFFECTTAGVTASSAPSYDYTVGNTTTDGTAVFTARDAWTRHAKVAAVINNFNFTLDRDPDPRGITGWYNQGGLRMDSGYSEGMAFQIGSWTLSTRMLTIHMPLGAANNDTLIHVNDWLEIWPGCNFTIAMCSGRYDNALNFRGEPYFAGAAAVAEQF